ncbi:glutathione synthetase [Podospora fimiseda]|uniref:Glutathione synthetase n=1 Tax=Podospora fimiseda TaxID=252190 RepID=A0AAN6YP36_9PEZI|nr:glutathione synthetase [Podospora fimiseda]
MAIARPHRASPRHSLCFPSSLPSFNFTAHTICIKTGMAQIRATFRPAIPTRRADSTHQMFRLSTRHQLRSFAVGSTTKPRVAVLCQAIDPPFVTKPGKPVGKHELICNYLMNQGYGYRDSGADIAYGLQKSGIQVITPTTTPDPVEDDDWCFPDDEAGILSAILGGATHLWAANTNLSSSHPLHASLAIAKHADSVHVVGQPPKLVELFDNKEHTNNLLRKHTNFPLPTAYTLDTRNDGAIHLPSNLAFPLVAKPIRGRGSHGVRVCHDKPALVQHLSVLLQESLVVMLESFLSGEEATIAVMPPSNQKPRYWALPVVTRFNHEQGIAPYNDATLTSNCRAIAFSEFQTDATYTTVCRQCEQVAELLKVTAPIQIDVRRFTAERGSPFVIFDINMKPVSF